MEPEEILNGVGDLLAAAPSRDDVIEAVYLTMRMISHRAVLASQDILPKTYLARQSKSSRASRRLALAVVEGIERQEGSPLYGISRERLDAYTVALSRAVRQRLKRELHYDERRGQELLEKLRRIRV